MNCANRAAVVTAINKFVEWANCRPNCEPKVLWVSLHGVPPDDPNCVGTAAASAAYQSGRDPNEIVHWDTAIEKLCGACPPEVVVVVDICGGGSPTAPARTTDKNGNNPALFFGPVRSAHRLELDTATGILFSGLARGSLPTVEEAREIVSYLNTRSPTDAANGKPFYRVWWWEQDGTIGRFPNAPESKFSQSHVVPN